jgi:hypothetical protein
MGEIVYKMSDVLSLSDDFQNKFAILSNLELGEKLTIYGGRLHKDTNSGYLQPITRWWDGQGRERILNFIEEEIDAYTSYLNFVRGAYYSSKCAYREKSQLLNVYREHYEVIENIVKGLLVLSQTYQDSPDIETSLGKITKKLNHIPKIN